MLRQSLGNEWVELGEKLTARRLAPLAAPQCSTSSGTSSPWTAHWEKMNEFPMPLTFTRGLSWAELCEEPKGSWVKIGFCPEPCPPGIHNPVSRWHLSHEPKRTITMGKTQCSRGCRQEGRRGSQWYMQEETCRKRYVFPLLKLLNFQ